MYPIYELVSKSKDSFIELGSLKKYLRVDHNYDDEYIIDLIDVALTSAENYLSLQLKETKWKVVYSDYVPITIKLKNGPVRKIESFKSISFANDTHFLERSFFTLDSSRDEIHLKNHLIINKAEITYLSGYNSITLPIPIKQGMLEHIAQMYDLRGQNQGLLLAAKSLYQPYKKVRL